MVQISISGKNLVGLLKTVLTSRSFSKLSRIYFSDDSASQILGLLYKYCQEQVTDNITPEEFKVLCLFYGIKISGINDSGFQLYYQDISTEMCLPISRVKQFALAARQILQYSREFHSELENLLNQSEDTHTEGYIKNLLLIHINQIVFQKELVAA
jgi:hypothetical protein